MPAPAPRETEGAELHQARGFRVQSALAVVRKRRSDRPLVVEDQSAKQVFDSIRARGAEAWVAVVPGAPPHVDDICHWLFTNSFVDVQQTGFVGRNSAWLG